MNTVHFVEQDCTFHGHTANGAIATDDILIAYMGTNGIITDWHGEAIGTYKITKTWKTPRSYVSTTMHQLQITAYGIKYTGRCAGTGMLFRGKRCAKQ